MLPDIKEPGGWSYEWKRYSLCGEVDAGYLAECERQGWEFVPPACHPSLNSADGKIIYAGLVLMRRADEAQLMARRAAQKAADDQYNKAAAELENAFGQDEGTIERVNRVPFVKLNKDIGKGNRE